jgi:F-type H+/Na+-transporting ATPase subunit alpha
MNNLSKDIKNISVDPDAGSGIIQSTADGVVWASGLNSAMYGEVVKFESGANGLCLNIEEDRTGIIILAGDASVGVGQSVSPTNNLLTIGVSEAILNRVIDPLGNPLDDKGPVKVKEKMPIEKIAPGVIERAPVDTPLQTGVLIVDALTPIGRGQRQLIIGDRGTGKTSIAIDAIINQKDKDVICIYVAIGQKRAKIAQIIETLDTHEALTNTVVVVASASDPSSIRFIAPYAGCAIAEYFMNKGRDVLIVYDDLTKHAWSYRELSLLLRRPSGREAYPGDIFYLHSRLLERAAKMSKKSGSGSITALPIIETLSGDVSAYIPTNVISITDGQIYLEGDLFFAGVRPAMNVGLSVSRIGGAAQITAMKKIAGKLRLDLSQYAELETFAQFATDLDAATKEKIERGKRLTEILKQQLNTPMPVAQQVVMVRAATSGLLDDLPVSDVRNFLSELVGEIEKKHKKLLTEIEKKGELSDTNKVIIEKVSKKLKGKFN